MYKLPKALILRLKSLAISDEEINGLIEKYELEAREYISLMLPNLFLTDIQKEILYNTYIQYQLFSYVELENLVQDKKIFLDDMITKILENEDKKMEEEKKESANSKRIRVF